MADNDPTIWWLAGRSPADLLDALDNQAAGTGSVAGTGPARLGIVAPDERKVRLARRLVAKGNPWRGRSDIWFTPAGVANPHGAGSPGKIALLFPGVEPSFGADQTDLPALARRLGLAPPAIDDQTIAHRSASIFRLGIFLDQVLRRLGVEPHMIAGHSVGEWSGTVASGILPPERANDLVGAADLGAVDLPDLDFAAVAAGAGTVLPVIRPLPEIDLSHDNCPRQSIICGPPERIATALDLLRAEGIIGYKLPFQSGFHTPAVAHLVDVFRPDAEALPFRPAAIPLWSATTVAPYPSTREEIIDLHLRHLVEPVRFGPLIQRLYRDAGARVFVQAGIGSLTGFVEDTLDGLDHACISALNAKRSALAQAHRLLTALWVEGIDVRADALRPHPELRPPRVDPERHDRQPASIAPAASRTDAVRPAARPAGNGSAGRAPAPNQTLVATAEILTAAANAGRDAVEALALRLGLPPSPAWTAPSPVGSELSRAPGNGTGRLGVPAPDVSGEHDTADDPVTSAGWPAGKVKIVRHLSLDTNPETLDHTLFDQPEGWPDPSDRFPIMAMTTQIQMLQDITAGYADGRDVTEVFGVRNLRWLDLSDPQDVEITVAPQDDEVLSLVLDRYCRANVRAGQFSAPPTPSAPPLEAPRTPDHTAQDLFDQGLMFHGPQFQGITHLGPIGDNGMSGEFRHLPTPGSLLDNLGKLIAYWVMDQGGLGEAALPIGVERIQFFGPDPTPGTLIHCDIRIDALERDLVRADGELVLPDGTLWCRVKGWSSIVFHRDEHTEPIYYDPSRRQATEPQPGGWSILVERWPTGPARELTARRFLSRPEREAYETLNLLQQRRRLIDLVAAKDVVRHWLWETYRIPCFPVEVTVTDDGDRRFRAHSRHIPDGHDLRVTLSSLDWLAVAILGDGLYRDIEARVIVDGADPASTAAAAASAVADRNPGAAVASIERANLIPSRLQVAPPPPFSVAWTAGNEPQGT